MNTVKDYVNFYLQLIYIDVWEDVTLLKIYPISLCVRNKTEDLDLCVFNITTQKNELKALRKCKFDRSRCESFAILSCSTFDSAFVANVANFVFKSRFLSY